MAAQLGVLVRLFAIAISLSALGATSTATAPTASASPATPAKDRIRDQYGRLPLSFERNQGQSDPRVEFLARGHGYTMFLTRGAEAVLTLHGAAPSESTAVVQLTLVGADTNARARGRDELPGKVNYLLSSDQKQWRTGIATFAKVAYANVYPGIDVVYYGNQQQLEYDFVVRPGSNPRTIALDIDGADALEIDGDGDLVMTVGGREVRQRKPVVYQETARGKKEIAGRYTIDWDRRVSFHIADYDASRSLVIDPVLVYSTYLGGAASDQGADDASDVAVDAAGNAYVTGTTTASDFPTTAGAFDTTAHLYDTAVFVTKFNAAGTALVYSTLLSGQSTEAGRGVAVDSAGNAYVTGSTHSPDFPTTPGAFDRSYNNIAAGGPSPNSIGVPLDLPDSDAFVTKLNATGTALVYSPPLEVYPTSS